MAEVDSPDKDPEAGKSGVGGTYTTGINPDPGGDTETAEALPGKSSPSDEDETTQTETES